MQNQNDFTHFNEQGRAKMVDVGEKPPTRESSLVLNRIAQLIAGEGRADIKYNGMVLKDIDSKVREALRPQQNGGEA